MLHIVIMSQKLSAPFRIRLKPDTKLQTQRSTKIPIQFKKNLNALLDDLKKNEKKNRTIWLNA